MEVVVRNRMGGGPKARPPILPIKDYYSFFTNTATVFVEPQLSVIVSVTVVSAVIPPLLASAVNVNGATAVTTGSEIAAELLEVTV